MYLEIRKIGSDFAIDLHEPQDFRRFHVSVGELTHAEVQQALAETGAGSLASTPEDHCWIHTSVVVAQALPAAADPAWQLNFDTLMDHAAGKGWVDASGSMLLGHVSRT